MRGATARARCEQGLLSKHGTGPGVASMPTCWQFPRSLALTTYSAPSNSKASGLLQNRLPASLRDAQRASGSVAGTTAGTSMPNSAGSAASPEHFVSRLFAAFAAAVVSLSPIPASAEDGLTIRFKASKDPVLRQAQEAMVETWGYVKTQFLDAQLNGVDWQRELQSSLDESFSAKKADDVYSIADSLLSKLGDPFTRLVRPNVAGAFENATEGQIVGMGFQVGRDTAGSLRISLVADGTPAGEAGVRPGDFLLAVNGRDAKDFAAQDLAAELRSEADLVLSRPSDSAGGASEELRLHLRPKPIEVHPVQFAALPGQNGEGKVGYVRLVVFSKNAPRDVENALKELQAQHAQPMILDLRDNVGGVILSAYEVAQLFLPVGARFCYVEDGRGAAEDVRMAESRQLTQQPMVVLVNGGTASSAELVAAALHDNGRAPLVGELTFGKGRTQRVIPLRGGALLLLSNTRYLTPDHRAVDKIGLTPDVACKPEVTETTFWASGDQSGSEALLDDPCVRLARDRLLSPAAT